MFSQSSQSSQSPLIATYQTLIAEIESKKEDYENWLELCNLLEQSSIENEDIDELVAHIYSADRNNVNIIYGFRIEYTDENGTEVSQVVKNTTFFQHGTYVSVTPLFGYVEIFTQIENILKNDLIDLIEMHRNNTF